MSEFYIDLDYVSEERYDFAKFLSYANNGFDPLSSRFLNQLNTLEASGKFIVTTEENRPDLIAYYIYGDTQYWWIILEYNNILSFDDLVTGVELKYPSLSSLELLYFDLKASESAKGS